MATHSHALAWEIPWVAEPGGLQSMGLQTDTIEQLTHIFPAILILVPNHYG